MVKNLLFILVCSVVCIGSNANTKNICDQLKKTKKATAFVVSENKISNQIDVGEHSFKEYLKYPLMADIFVYPSWFTLAGDCPRSCLSVQKVKSECKGFSKYRGKFEIEPLVFGIGKFDADFQLSLSDPKADLDQGFESSQVNITGVFHGGSMGIVQGNGKEIDDFFLSRASSLAVTLKNFGDLPVNIGTFYVLPDSANLATIAVNSCANKIIPANATCEFMIKPIGKGGFPKKNGTVLTVAFENDGLGDGNGVLYFTKSDEKTTLYFRQGYSQ